MYFLYKRDPTQYRTTAEEWCVIYFVSVGLKLAFSEVGTSSLFLLPTISSVCQYLPDWLKCFWKKRKVSQMWLPKVAKLFVTLKTTKQVSALYFFQKLIFCKWTSVRKLFSFLLFNTIVCFVLSPSLTFPFSKSEAEKREQVLPIKSFFILKEEEPHELSVTFIHSCGYCCDLRLCEKIVLQINKLFREY